MGGEPVEPRRPPGLLEILRGRGPGVRVGARIVRRRRRDLEMAIALARGRHHAAIVPAVDRDERDLGVG